MVAMYTVFGRQVGSHYLAMATLGAMFGSSYLAMRGGEKKTAQGPPINASSKDEETFIQDFLKSVQDEEAKAKAKA
ncbi:hypothetical protein EPUS_01184 [Endocarpon pusillum Z07020]|uniref:ATP synthase subunit K n=1 Tax=Endocarpon pusillum (strain Z07020 / HMAS-L-300199) TaxID=1263415 RepID=U1FWK5_ENDPU|nr:uncharacterized protein EPUS_01184 [Endocarpon pusillum Z07020]ERF69227.1 hypothetical protein EPUS_01184 [Endocarpon pusillum Z07020]